MKNKIINFALKDTDINFSEDIKAFVLAIIICFAIAYIAQVFAFI
jgi:hypothetical protein